MMPANMTWIVVGMTHESLDSLLMCNELPQEAK